MPRTVVTSPHAPHPPAPLSQAIRKGPILQLSGQVAFDTAGHIVGTTVTEQTDQVMRNITAVLRAGGANLDDVVLLRVNLTDTAHFADMNSAYQKYWDSEHPARTTFYGPLPEGLLVEIEALAVLDG
ncbi:RidA family protein [Streptomyces cyanogenus]|uniref:Enamine/imine deaminase n=1 Tax=Streptomyces cyanogenus TaxID=80860 RepID=A0ABX7TJS2_STRCY|nr:RidA family protein [Streptomyces cyanogenus]QTD96657.1 Enamine/imine deaminase [Streptomyces cyanogenus]